MPDLISISTEFQVNNMILNIKQVALTATCISMTAYASDHDYQTHPAPAQNFHTCLTNIQPSNYSLFTHILNIDIYVDLYPDLTATMHIIHDKT